MMRSDRFVGAALISLAIFAAPESAAAFEDANFFAYPPSGAGAGGRYFTGSPRDAYACDACHSGGKAPALHVLGLPLAGYVPGAHYELTVDWSDDLAKVSAVVEVTDMSGRRAGTLRLPGDDEVLAPEFCEDDDVSAARLIRVPPPGLENPREYCRENAERAPADCREVIHVEDCGAQRVRMLWTAPGRSVGTVWFAGSAVSANSDSTPDGDGVTGFGRAVASPSEDGAVETATTSCGAVPGRRGGSLFLLLSIVAACGVRHHRKRSSPQGREKNRRVEVWIQKKH